MSATARLEVRVRPESKARIQRAAKLEGQEVSDFVRGTVEARAERVIAEHDTMTVVPPEFYDELMAALDAPNEPSLALQRAAALARDIVKR